MKAKIAQLVDQNPFDRLLKKCILSWKEFALEIVEINNVITGYVLSDNDDNDIIAFIGARDNCWKLHHCPIHGLLAHRCCCSVVEYSLMGFCTYLKAEFNLTMNHGEDNTRTFKPNLQLPKLNLATIPSSFRSIIGPTDSMVLCNNQTIVPYHKVIIPNMPQVLGFEKDVVQLYVNFKMLFPIEISCKDWDQWFDLATHMNDEDAKIWLMHQAKVDLKWLYDHDCL